MIKFPNRPLQPQPKKQSSREELVENARAKILLAHQESAEEKIVQLQAELIELQDNQMRAKRKLDSQCEKLLTSEENLHDFIHHRYYCNAEGQTELKRLVDKLHGQTIDFRATKLAYNEASARVAQNLNDTRSKKLEMAELDRKIAALDLDLLGV